MKKYVTFFAILTTTALLYTMETPPYNIPKTCQDLYPLDSETPSSDLPPLFNSHEYLQEGIVNPIIFTRRKRKCEEQHPKKSISFINNTIKIMPVNQSSIICGIDVTSCIEKSGNNSHMNWKCPACFSIKNQEEAKSTFKRLILLHLLKKHNLIAQLEEILISRGITKETIEEFISSKKCSQFKQCLICNKLLKEKTSEKSLSWRQHFIKHITILYNAQMAQQFLDQALTFNNTLERPLIPIAHRRKSKNTNIITVTVPNDYILGTLNRHNQWEFKCPIDTCSTMIPYQFSRVKNNTYETIIKMKFHILKEHYREALQQNTSIKDSFNKSLFSSLKECPVIGCEAKYSERHFTSHVSFNNMVEYDNDEYETEID